MTTDRTGKFAGDDPVALVASWLQEAKAAEVNDPNAMALSTVDADGIPNVRIVLLKEIEADAFVFYTNYDSTKGQELDATGRAAFVLHWKSLRRQVRVQGTVTREDGPQADAYYASRPIDSRIGAWASRQSRVIADRQELMDAVETAQKEHGDAPTRPEFWGGYRIRPTRIEFWADGHARLHDRFVWSRKTTEDDWSIARLSP